MNRETYDPRIREREVIGYFNELLDEIGEHRQPPYDRTPERTLPAGLPAYV